MDHGQQGYAVSRILVWDPNGVDIIDLVLQQYQPQSPAGYPGACLDERSDIPHLE
jgi:hypothetical protein